MLDAVRVRLITLFRGKLAPTNLWKLVVTAFGCSSSIYAVAKLASELAGIDVLKSLLEAHWTIVVFAGVVMSLIKNREQTNHNVAVKGEGYEMQLSVRDMLSTPMRDLFSSLPTSFVVPTNTFFRTKMEGEYISAKSVQGQFQRRYFKNNLAQLDGLIADDLVSQGLSNEPSTDMFGEVRKYPLGTVAKVDVKGRHYYFVAICDVNKNGKPINQRLGNVDIALKGLCDALRERGNCDKLVIPLLGAGRAAIDGATCEVVAQRIIDKFTLSNEKLSECVVICLRPLDYIEERFSFPELTKYLDFRCTYKR